MGLCHPVAYMTRVYGKISLSEFAHGIVQRVLQHVAVCCNVLQCVATHCGTFWGGCPGHRLIRVAVCCSVLQYVAVCCSMLQSVWCSVLQCAVARCCVLQCAAECCSVLQCVAAPLGEFRPMCVAMCCSMLQSVCCSVLQCGVACCNLLQCVAMCCSTSWRVCPRHRPMLPIFFL